MKLIFVRHGQAGPYCADDAGRDLTDFGRQQAHETADFLVNYSKESPVNVIIASPYNRANQTATIILESLMDAEQNPAFITISSITPDDDPNIGLDDIDCAIRHKFGMETDELTVIIVCHMPIVARMAAILDGLSPSGFELAECRVFGAEVMAPELAKQIAQFIPTQP
ncbi:phosphoglycerate mutase family protein [Moraxella bovoculi]|uniref:phosphoglycerate mutase family protein n=1 Tax=Moraxella bovoculi TaxID=386891 RepID=UPI003F504FDE